MCLAVYGKYKLSLLFLLRIIYVLKFYFFFSQNLNKQAYDLAKALLKRTAQAIEPYITNVSEDCKQIWKSMNFQTLSCIIKRINYI